MSDPFEKYEKKKDFLICIDSDGCAVDSMDIKHIRCFGPCMVREWGLFPYEDTILKRWNQINLYSMTRGINRFQGLALSLEEIDRTLTPIEDVESLVRWAENSRELSNRAVQEAAEQTGSSCLRKALAWSEAVNRAIQELPREEVKPFAGVKEQLAGLHSVCDAAVVSSANYEAVKDEWTRFGLTEHVDLLLAQNAGSKKDCIERLLRYGYERDKVMMIGDAPGDMKAARENGVFYYPILVKHEAESWNGVEEAVRRLREGTFAGGYQEKKIREFIDNLS